MSSSKWTAADLPSLDGKTIVVTGANSGLGLVTARELALHGAKVVLAVRDTAKGDRAAADIRGDTEVRALDLADLGSVRAFAETWDGPLDVLINNAGIMAIPLQRTKDGFEMQIGTNHLGHFALTNLLLPHVTERVVTLASGAHRIGKMHLGDLNWEENSYQRWGAYGQSKLANLLFTMELERRLAEADSDVHAYAAHPGYARTALQSRTQNVVQNAIMAVGNRVIAQSDEMGALPTLYAATQEIPGGSYVGPDGFQEQRGHPTLVGRSGRASDAGDARTLWELSEELTDVTFPLSGAAA